MRRQLKLGHVDRISVFGRHDGSHAIDDWRWNGGRYVPHRGKRGSNGNLEHWPTPGTGDWACGRIIFKSIQRLEVGFLVADNSGELRAVLSLLKLYTSLTQKLRAE